MELKNNKELTTKYREKAAKLVSRMTLEAKIEQMVFRAPAIPELHVKAYTWWNEALHGVARAGTATVFPQAIAMAATFDEDLLEEVGAATAKEARAKFNASQKFNDTDIYKGLTFWAPNVNIFRDPRWGRGHETYGEDPYLTSRMGVRFVEGLQGHDEEHLMTAACAKHFAVHSGPEDMRHYFNAEVSEKDLQETYLPAFKALVQEAGVESVMGAYNRTNGEPCCGSKRLLKDILRGEWGFEGHVTSDCWAIQDFHMHHRVTENAVESAALAVKNGCDLNCGEMYYHLLEGVRQGLVPEEDIDAAVINLFTTRMKLGIFDDREEHPFSDIPYSVVDSEEMKALNLRTSAEGIVLLSNKEKTLPLKLDEIKTIGVVGPNANNRRALVGNYEGTSSRYITPLEGIQDYAESRGVRVLFSQACHLFKDKCECLSAESDRFSELNAVIEESDVIIACMGLDSGLEGEEGDEGNAYASGDKKDLSLPGMQNEVLRILANCGKKVILVNITGSAVTFDGLEESFAGILQCFYPGAQGGRAIAQILFGEKSPEGKLPVTFYKNTEDLPEFTDYSMSGRTYRYMPGEALYPFGYGLTYGDFEVEETEVDEGDKEVKLRARIRNKSSNEALVGEKVQVYASPTDEAIYRLAEDGDELGEIPGPSLKAFKRVELGGGSSSEVEITVKKENLCLITESGKTVYPDEWELYVRFSQPTEETDSAICGGFCR